MQREPKHFEALYPDVSRSEELAQVVSYIKEGNSVQLIGLPGVGRSTLLGFLSYNKGIRLRHFPQNHAIVHFVMMNFSEVRNRPLFDVMKLLFLNLAESLREREMDAEYEYVSRLLKDALSFQDELVLTQGLKKVVEYLALEKKLTLIFLFDRFDEYIPFVTSEFFTNLRSLRDKAKYRFSVVFSLSRPLEETLEPQLFSDFSDFVTGHQVYVPLLDLPSLTFRLDYLEQRTGKTLPPKVREQLIELTGGHVRLTKLAAEAVSGEAAPLSDLLSFLLSQKAIEQAFLSIWQSLTPSEQEYLLSNEHEEGHAYLGNIGLLQGERIHPPLVAAFLQEKRNELEAAEGRLMYDEATNTIRKGNTLLSDSLTKAEFRLLRYLLLHPDQVVEREELINAVWSETATTVGVTEQAVDQLIFRLRRKIEKDPNNPIFLQTIKGRGVKLSS